MPLYRQLAAQQGRLLADMRAALLAMEAAEGEQLGEWPHGPAPLTCPPHTEPCPHLGGCGRRAPRDLPACMRIRWALGHCSRAAHQPVPCLSIESCGSQLATASLHHGNLPAPPPRGWGLGSDVTEPPFM